MRRLAAITAFLLLSSLGCTAAHQLAIAGAIGYSEAVMAVDDAEWDDYVACSGAGLPDPASACQKKHDVLNGPIKSALLSAKAVDLAVQAAPTSVPAALPDLLLELDKLQKAVNAINGASPQLKARIDQAQAAALRLLARIVNGGKA